MPSRRSVLAFLGLTPIVAPAAIAAVTTPELVIVGADVTEAGVTVGHVVTPAMIRAEAIAQRALVPDPADLRAMLIAIRRSHAELVQTLSSPRAEGDR